MTNHLFAATALAALLAAAPAIAQDTTPAPADQTKTGEVQLLGDLDTGESVPAEGAAAAQAAQKAQSYVLETNGDWQVQCLRVPEGQTEPCQMYQLLKDPEGNPVAEASLFRLNGGGQVVAGGTFVVPLETLLTQRLTIQVDTGQAKRYDYSFCTRGGCYARVGFTAEDIARFKAGAAAKLTLVPALAPDQKVSVEMSLKGFTASFDKVTPVKQGG